MRSKKRARYSNAGVAAVDVHCHVFNARDVPVRKFVELVYLEKIPGGSLADPLIDLIELLMRSGAPTTGQEIDQLKQANLTASRLKTTDNRARDIRIVSRALALMWYRSPIDRRWVRQHFSPRLRKQFRGKRKIAVTRAQFRETARYLRGLGDIWTWIQFALNYTKPRWRITELLASLSATQAKDVFLYTPLMLDIGYPLGEVDSSGEVDTSSIKEQVELMSLISQIKGRSYAVHAFVAFDPFRAKYEPDALPIVMDAVLNRGAIGVKLYPPMGFKPCGNSDPGLERQMKLFLEFCLKEDVPIVAHCSFSQYVSEDKGACAAPEAWRAFLQQRGHENLRLDLGHCGGPWDLTPNSVTKTIWTETVIAMLGSGKYPNLYADLSDDSAILDPYGADNQNIMTQLHDFLKNNQKARTRLLYGSDWSLLARVTGANNYYASMKTYFCQLLKLNFTAAEQQGYLGGNALCFLGLAKNKDGSKPKNRQRLENFRSNHGLDMSIFTKIDALGLQC